MNKSEQFWDKASNNYDKTEERFEYIHNKSRENTKKYLKDSDYLMDYGCGTGTTSCEIAHLVKEICAIDISSKMILIAKEKALDSNIQNVNFEKADIYEEKYETKSFDTILAFNMLHTVVNPQKLVQRIFKLLKPKGLFISVTPCLGGKMSFWVSAQIRFVQILCKIGIIPIPIRRLKSAEIEHLILNENFHKIETEEIYKGATSYFIVAQKNSELAKNI